MKLFYVLTLFWSTFILITDFLRSRLLNHDIHSLVSSLHSSIRNLNLCDYFYLLTGVNVPQEIVFSVLKLRQNSVQTLKVATRLLQPDTRSIKHSVLYKISSLQGLMDRVIQIYIFSNLFRVPFLHLHHFEMHSKHANHTQLLLYGKLRSTYTSLGMCESFHNAS